jgi:hypothetical protein
MIPTGNRLTQLNNLLNIYISQYGEEMRQINLRYIEVSRMRAMIDNVANDIRGMEEVPSEVLPVPRSPNPYQGHGYGQRHWTGQTFSSSLPSAVHSSAIHSSAVHSSALHSQNTMDPSFNNLSFNVPGVRASVNFYDRIIIAPTERQLHDSTAICEFRNISHPINDICPISLRPFDRTEDVMRILYCGHIFGRQELTEWFQNNIRCPVCRHDLRDNQDFNGETKDSGGDGMPNLDPISNDWD